MSRQPAMTALPGSERAPMPDARLLGPVDDDELIEVTLVLRRPPGGDLDAAAPGAAPISRARFAAGYGALQSDIRQIELFYQAHGASIVQSSTAARTITLAGTAAQMNRAFAVTLQRYASRRSTYRSFSGPVHLPAALAALVQGVFGLDDRPIAERLGGSGPTGFWFTPQCIADYYQYPASSDGKGQTVGFLQFGGGFLMSELTEYFALSDLKVPTITTVELSGAKNDPKGDSAEATVDIEIFSSVAPAAQVVVYFAPNTEKGWIDACTGAVHDTVNQPSVLSISWGYSELFWIFNQQLIDALESVFVDATWLGVTVCAASGDCGSPGNKEIEDGRNHVIYPASSPNVLGCGGTVVRPDGSGGVMEVVWDNDDGSTGGGVSEVFPLPWWQKLAGVAVPASANPGGKTGRGVPDVAAHSDVYLVRYKKRWGFAVGTSYAAPMWAALIARLNQRLGTPLGFANAAFYQLGTTSNVFNDITSGKNGAYTAGVGWDACTGLGSPNGTALLEALRCRTMTLTLEMQDQLCKPATQGRTSQWFAHLSGASGPDKPTFVWTVVGGGVGPGTASGPHLSIDIPDTAGPFDVSVSVTIDGCTKTASMHVDPVPSDVADALAHLCDLFTDVRHQFVLNKLWDPLRDFTARPRSAEALARMREVVGELHAATGKLLAATRSA